MVLYRLEKSQAKGGHFCAHRNVRNPTGFQRIGMPSVCVEGSVKESMNTWLKGTFDKYTQQNNSTFAVGRGKNNLKY